jgi:SNF2 family DNA or RNA helicase
VLAVTLEHAMNRTYKLTLEEHVLLNGEQNCWILSQPFLYHCSPEYSRDMSIFLQEMRKLKDNELFLSDKQMQPFCGNVLKAIMPHIDLQSQDVELSAFMPSEVSFSLYLDTPYSNTITCTAYAQYNDKRFSLTMPIDYDDIYRDAAREHHVLSAIKTYFHPCESDEVEGDFIIENDDHAIFLFLEQGLPHFYQLGEVYISENMKRIRIVNAPKATIGVSLSGNLLELDIQSNDLPYDELTGILDSYKRRMKYYKLKSGDYLRLEDNSLSVLSELVNGLNLSEKDILNGKINVPLYRASYIDSVLTHHNEDIHTHRDRYFKSLIRDLKLVEDSDYEVPAHLQSILRDYQKTGYRWLQTIAHLGFGGILADDMGLGKTLQMITLLANARQEDPHTVSLIICPSSLVYNWDSEIERFAPELRTLLIIGNAAERHEKLTHYQEFDVLITSYDMLKRDVTQYQDLAFRYQIIDEAQYIKNHHTQAARSVRQIHSVTRFALTGTPIENRLSELWSIFEYLMPGFLYPYQYFKNEIEQPIVEIKDEIAVNRLHQMIKPFIMRRLKQDVLQELPEKQENAVYAQMTNEQQHLYDASVLRLQKGLEDQSEAAFHTNKIQILAELTKLRQLCCDPSLIFDHYKGGSAKLDTCIQLIQNAIASGHKVLLFSQFTSMLDIIESRLRQENILYYRLDGSTKSEQRAQLVKDFNRNSIPVFMISLKAGGTGLNLTGADIVIHYDPWWNVAAQNQATDRAHRIGQTRTVTVYKIIARHTIEEKIMKLQEAKQELAEQIISGEGSIAANLTRDDLLRILQ